ncbi:MAG: hypothetical protein WBW94_15060, partial [Anaerolineales bacterium]
AKKSEMAFEKQLEAFREITEGIGNIRRISALYSNRRNKESINKYFAELYKAHEDFYASFQRQRVYLPPDIAEHTINYGAHVFQFFSKKDYRKQDKYYDELVKKGEGIITRMQAAIGYKH